MIPTRIFFQIHYSRRLLITYWLNDFLSCNLVSFRIVSSAFKLLIHPNSVSSFVWSRYGVFFCNWTLSTRLLETQADYQPRLQELYRGVRGHAPWEKNLENWTLWNAILHSLDQTRLIYTCILLSFSQSLVIHDSRAEVQRFMIPKFLKQKSHDSYMFCKYDSWFMILLLTAIIEFNNCFIIRSPSLGSEAICHFHLRAIATRRKAWFRLRISRILFAANSVHEQTIICRHLFAGHVVSSRPMKRKKNLQRMIISFI